MTKIPILTTQELNKVLTNNKCKIVDVRSSDAYNGWKLNGEIRGGHIKGARCLPVKWANYIDWIEIVFSKNLAADDNIVIYGYTAEESNIVATRFIKAGFKNIFIYNDFVNEWSANTDLPMENLPRHKNLVPPEWVNNIINSNQSSDYVICHAHYRNRDAYLSGHIPGAIDIDSLALESPKTWNRRTPSELKKSLEAHGITSVTNVILYGKYMSPDNDDDFPGSSAGHLGAIRCAFIMMYAGVKNVYLLNGGYQSWIDNNYPVETTDIAKKPVKNFGVSIPQQHKLAVDLPEAKEMISSNNAELVCVRSWPEYIGEVSGYNYIQKKGRIPGVVFGNCGTDAYHMENYRNIDHTIREYHEVEKIWSEIGITPDKKLAFYCGTGWRGSEAFYNAWLMGWTNVSVFDGGWFEWSNDPENPTETGLPNKEKVLQS